MGLLNLFYSSPTWFLKWQWKLTSSGATRLNLCFWTMFKLPTSTHHISAKSLFWCGFCFVIFSSFQRNNENGENFQWNSHLTVWVLSRLVVYYDPYSSFQSEVNLPIPLVIGPSPNSVHKSTSKTVQRPQYWHFILYFSRDTTVKLWSTSSKEEVKSLGGHTATVTCVKFLKDKPHQTYPAVVSGSYDCSVRVWDLDNRKQLTLLLLISPGGTFALGADFVHFLIKHTNETLFDTSFFSCFEKAEEQERCIKQGFISVFYKKVNDVRSQCKCASWSTSTYCYVSGGACRNFEKNKKRTIEQ